MQVVQYRSGQGLRVGLLQAAGVLDFTGAYQAYRLVVSGQAEPPYTGTEDLLAAGLFTVETFGAVVRFLQEHGLQDQYRVQEYRLEAPLRRPGKIIALGRNYAAHALEHGREIPTEPIIFAKPPSSIVGPEAPVIYKPWLTRMDPEVELAFIIGRAGADIPRERAGEHIAGWTVANDVTARDLQFQDIAQAQPWFRSKGMDTFCPLGPCIVLPDEITLPVALDLELRVNGQVRQRDNTRSLIFPPDALVAFISRYMSLEPGDLICTGTPEGMKPVLPGDLMEATVQGIGTLRNPVLAG